jgi:hypothetical protein
VFRHRREYLPRRRLRLRLRATDRCLHAGEQIP